MHPCCTEMLHDGINNHVDMLLLVAIPPLLEGSTAAAAPPLGGGLTRDLLLHCFLCLLC